MCVGIMTDGFVKRGILVGFSFFCLSLSVLIVKLVDYICQGGEKLTG